MSYCVGIDIGGTTVKLGLFTEGGSLVKKWEIPTRKGTEPTGLLQDVQASLAEQLAESGITWEDLLGIGIAAPGPVTADGILHGTVNIGWGDVKLGACTEAVLGISPVAVGNDARVAALGEAIFGAAKGEPSMLMVTLGTGVGGGVILNGKILQGESGVAGEIGHMTIDPYEAELCSCGKKGCLEQYASATGMVRTAGQFLAKSQEDSLLRQRESLTAKGLWEAAKQGDRLANEVADFVCQRLGMALANAVYLVDPACIVIGGGVAAAGEDLLERVRQSYRQNVFPHSREKRFALAELGNDAGIYGAAALLLQARAEKNRQ